jgi:SRSO17 transposase
VTAPAAASAQHQSLLHLVGESPWSDEAMLGRVRDKVLPDIERHGAIEAWIIDETSFPKHGPHSVGVSHQYCGQLGKQANCQLAVSVSLANHHASLPVAWRPYLPKNRAEDHALRQKTGIPGDIEFATKPKIALARIEQAVAAGLPSGVVLGDTVYGVDLALRRRLRALGLDYSLAVQERTLVTKVADDGPSPAPMQALALARSLPKRGWRVVGWRDGTNAPLSSRFQRVRVRAAGDGTSDCPSRSNG